LKIKGNFVAEAVAEENFVAQRRAEPEVLRGFLETTYLPVLSALQSQENISYDQHYRKNAHSL